MVTVFDLNRFVDEWHVLEEGSSENVLPCFADCLDVLPEELRCLTILESDLVFVLLEMYSTGRYFFLLEVVL